eukprot:gb/GECH01014436.1/.p1 GENE.gb/GECH01014436.1/~~gb/GECH01014436.1/.p1  ORF type:complete len:177 (+),score=20.85 gb/GECH01014436.1/:1-531(+)
MESASIPFFLIHVICVSGCYMAGYAWPAYRSAKLFYKHTEANDIISIEKKHKKWCTYWIITVFLMLLEILGASGIPLWYEMKFCFIIWLQNPKSKGSLIVYDRFIAPKLREEESNIDQNLENVKDRVRKSFVVYADQARIYFTQLMFNIMHVGQNFLQKQLEKNADMAAQRDSGNE